MKVIIIRHGKVNYKWSKWCTSDEFDKECSDYDNAPLEHMEQDIPKTVYENIYISTLSRSKNTAISLFGEGNLIQTEWIDEVPLKSSLCTKKRLPLWFWNLTGRLQWFFNNSRQIEGRLCTENRARKFVEMLCKEEIDSAVVTHGFYMHMLLRELKRAGFRTDRLHAYYKNGKGIMAEK